MSSLAQQAVPELEATLGFTRAADVSPDTERPRVLRARTLPLDADLHSAFDFRTCTLRDCAACETPVDLETMGFEPIDLSPNRRLQDVLAVIRREDRISEQSAARLRASLRGWRLRLRNGKPLRLLFIAPEGLIFRRAGPNGLQVNERVRDAANGHDGAQRVHGDQDVYGTPLKQMLRGGAPRLFRHETPDGCNRRSPFFLLNLWIPLQQITRPLVLMDRRTLDPKRHQLRYALPVTSFLERDEERSLNDIWAFLHDPGQQWYFHSEMDDGRAYLFDTLGQPHGACALPGESALEQLFLRLRAACDALVAGDAAALKAAAESAPEALPDVTTVPIRAAYQRMTALLEEIRVRRADLPQGPEGWIQRARAAMDRVIRKSVELRTVAVVAPRWWPL
ncbi:MAG: hypothetical protein MJE66_06290 [Proteobacteria bacterium]|nr:hypothetical protein [Pseudomonadota bacterium]